jgi:hypothetical protein
MLAKAKAREHACREHLAFLASQLPSRASGALLVLALLAFAPGSAGAALSVYQSTRDNGIDSGPARIHGHTLVHVYFNNGSTPAALASNRCTPLGGDEICQWAVRFETTGNLKIVDVAWGAGIIEDDLPSMAATQLDGTGGDAVNGNLGATKLATVAVSGTEGELRLRRRPAGFVATSAQPPDRPRARSPERGDALEGVPPTRTTRWRSETARSVAGRRPSRARPRSRRRPFPRARSRWGTISPARSTTTT